MNGNDLNNLMAPHQGHKVSFVLNENCSFDVIENQKMDIENIRKIKCIDCNIVIYGAVAQLE